MERKENRNQEPLRKKRKINDEECTIIDDDFDVDDVIIVEEDVVVDDEVEIVYDRAQEVEATTINNGSEETSEDDESTDNDSDVDEDDEVQVVYDRAQEVEVTTINDGSEETSEDDESTDNDNNTDEEVLTQENEQSPIEIIDVEGDDNDCSIEDARNSYRTEVATVTEGDEEDDSEESSSDEEEEDPDPRYLGPNSPYVRVKTIDGDVIGCRRDVLLMSGTARKYLENPAYQHFPEKDFVQFNFPIRSDVFRKIFQLMAYRHYYIGNNYLLHEEVPDGSITGVDYADLIAAAEYLDT